MSDSYRFGLALICCLPVLIIAVILTVAGGTGAGFMAPALVAGVMIGVLMFTGWSEPGHR